jgi:hypothetical protein
MPDYDNPTGPDTAVIRRIGQQRGFRPAPMDNQKIRELVNRIKKLNEQMVALMTEIVEELSAVEKILKQIKV